MGGCNYIFKEKSKWKRRNNKILLIWDWKEKGIKGEKQEQSEKPFELTTACVFKGPAKRCDLWAESKLYL